MPEDIFTENLCWWFSPADHEEEVKLFSFNIYTAFITIQCWLTYKYEAILLVQPPETRKALRSFRVALEMRREVLSEDAGHNCVPYHLALATR